MQSVIVDDVKESTDFAVLFAKEKKVSVLPVCITCERRFVHQLRFAIFSRFSNIYSRLTISNILN